jgi:hypothetical protein
LYLVDTKTYKVTLPKGILQAVNARHAAALPVPRQPGAIHPPAACADASTTVYFGRKQPDGIKRGNWIQTIPGLVHNYRDARTRRPTMEERTQTAEQKKAIPSLNSHLAG